MEPIQGIVKIDENRVMSFYAHAPEHLAVITKVYDNELRQKFEEGRKSILTNITKAIEKFSKD